MAFYPAMSDVPTAKYPSAGLAAMPTAPIDVAGSIGNVPISAKAPIVVNPSKGMSNTVPLPDYANAQSRLKYLQAMKQKYGDVLTNRGDTVLNVNEVPRAGIDTAKNTATKFGKQYGIDPALLYASSMEEGMSGLFKSKATGLDTKNRKPGEAGYQDYFGDKEYPINGGQSFGFQTFNQRFPDLVKAGLLPKEFASRFRSKDATITQGNVQAANDFKTPEDAMQAKAALMKYNYNYVDGVAKKKGITLSPAARDFFAMAAYNGGEGAVDKRMQTYSDNGLLKNDQFLTNRPASEESVRNTAGDVYGHILPRIKMIQLLKKEGLF